MTIEEISYLYDELMTELAKKGTYREEIKLIRKAKWMFVEKGFKLGK